MIVIDTGNRVVARKPFEVVRGLRYALAVGDEYLGRVFKQMTLSFEP